MRPNNRKNNEIRPITIEINNSPYAEGSCLIKFGNTVVHCTATVSDRVPRFVRNSGKGWITAEYGMLPRSTHQRMDREAARGGQKGRTHEIQRLIGRSLRAVTDLKLMGERQVIIDCDVIQADGGTRCASITGAYVALDLAFRNLIKKGEMMSNPLTEEVAAISCGIYKGECIADLEYKEDCDAEADVNFVLTASGKIVEIQGTAEDYPFKEEEFLELMALAKEGIKQIITKQKDAIGNEYEDMFKC